MMRIPRWNAVTWLSSLVSVALVSLVVQLAACAHTVVAQGTEVTPAARAEVKLKLDDNGNTQINIEVEHLSPPGRLEKSAKCYVAWVRDENGHVTNIGRLKVGKDRTGRLAASSPLQRFTLVITAESDPAVPSPQGPVVVETETIEMSS
jgi:hypothetical protein